jgi:signal transduction histidine kinase
VGVARRAGLDVDFTLEGDVGRIDPIVGLSLHRVADEALDNARRHAPRAATDVLLKVEDHAVVLVVESVGPLGAEEGFPSRNADRPRYGVVGMRERMAAVGGNLEAGPTPTGWVVRCRAPLGPGVSTAPFGGAEP